MACAADVGPPSWGDLSERLFVGGVAPLTLADAVAVANDDGDDDDNNIIIICRLPFAVCRLPFAVCRLPFAVCRSPFAVCHLPFATTPANRQSIDAQTQHTTSGEQ